MIFLRRKVEFLGENVIVWVRKLVFQAGNVIFLEKTGISGRKCHIFWRNAVFVGENVIFLRTKVVFV